MKTVNSLSGGKTSSYMAIHYPADYEIFSLVCIDDVRCKPKDPALIEYTNKKLSKFTDRYGEFIATAEDDMTIRAMMDLEQIIGKNIIWVRGKSFDNVVDGKNGGLPNKLQRFCTVEMKLEPIFYWWVQNVGERVKMRIGFRFDEYDRMENFMNNNPTTFKVPDTCNLYGDKRQKHKEFNFRFCTFPLIKDGIKHPQIVEYLDMFGFVGGDLFTERRKIEFPIISNCVGCFHKKIETLNEMSIRNPEKMNWFAEQENKQKGTWIKDLRYEDIIKMNKNVIPFMVEQELDNCSIGGCHG